MKLFILGLTLSAVLVGVKQAPGERYAGQASTGVTMSINGSYSSMGGNIGTAAVSIDLTLDTDSLTVLYNSVAVSATELSATFTDDFTVGIGETTTITTVIEFDPIVHSAVNFGPLQLTPGTGGLFDIEDGNPAFGNTFLMIGSYRISGPTESKDGVFSLPFNLTDFWTHVPNYRLDANQFPSAITLVHRPQSWLGYSNNSDYQPDFGDYVDGVPIDVDLRGMWFQSQEDILLSPVPEPSALTLVAFGLLGLLAGRPVIVARCATRHSTA